LIRARHLAWACLPLALSACWQKDADRNIDSLDAELTATGKTEFARQEFAAELTRPPKPPREDPWRRLSGLHTVRGRRSFAIARELWMSREEYARAQDVSPGRLVPDRALVAAIKAEPRTKGELAALKEFTGRASRSDLDTWWAAVQEGLTTSELPSTRPAGGGDILPPPRAWAERNPDADARLKAARKLVGERAEGMGMPVENLLTPEYLRRLAWEPPQPSDEAAVGSALEALGARGWQVRETASLITAAFAEAQPEIST